MKTVQLSDVLVTIVSDRDFESVTFAGPWRALVPPGRYTTYAIRDIRKPDGRWTTQRLHRFLLGVTDPKILVDHRDRDGLNNQRENLRIATNSQSNANQRKITGGSSRFRGVSRASKRRWRAVIRVNGKNIRLGRFNDEVEAALAYDAAAREHFGEFANLNFPPKKPALNAAPSDSLPVPA
jgi:hypothetical protein